MSYLENYIDYMYKTPSGGILCMKNCCAVVVQGNRVKILDSIEDYHTKFKGPKDPIQTWTELTNDVDKHAFLKAKLIGRRLMKERRP